MKVCNNPECGFKGQEQPLENFYPYKNGQGKVYLSNRCRACRAVRYRAYHQLHGYNNNPEDMYDVAFHRKLTAIWKGVRSYPTVNLLNRSSDLARQLLNVC